jgi:predicted amidophosphoribosyltransferase
MVHAMNVLLNLLFPAQCAACRTIGSGLCTACAPPDVPPVTRRLATMTVHGLGEYSGALRAAVLAVKDGRRDVAESLGARLAALKDIAAILVPVPTTIARRRVRGVDGVELMARTAARIAGASARSILTPLRSDAQRGRTRSERLAARCRFACRELAVTGLQVMLVDDVCTTGATLEDCGRALRAAGVSVSQALVVAFANE